MPRVEMPQERESPAAPPTTALDNLTGIGCTGAGQSVGGSGNGVSARSGRLRQLEALGSQGRIWGVTETRPN
jgi:hypothetical protein